MLFGGPGILHVGREEVVEGGEFGAGCCLHLNPSLDPRFTTLSISAMLKEQHQLAEF